MPYCANCNAHLTERYVRVRVPDDERPVRACVHCPDRVRDGAGYRKALSNAGDGRRGES